MRDDAKYVSNTEEVNKVEIVVVETAITDVSNSYQRMGGAHGKAEKILVDAKKAPLAKQAEIAELLKAMENELTASHLRYLTAKAAYDESGRICHARRSGRINREESESRQRRSDSK